jgi:hypothetical protein
VSRYKWKYLEVLEEVVFNEFEYCAANLILTWKLTAHPALFDVSELGTVYALYMLDVHRTIMMADYNLKPVLY